MNNRMYKLMNWPEIEAIVYAESDNPGKVLGPHSVGASTLFQAYIPDAKEVRLRLDEEDKSIKMEQVDENGFFALIHAGKTPDKYAYIAEYADETIVKYLDPYRYPVSFDKKADKAFASGDMYNAYDYLGAHITEIGNTKGTLFRVWAPAARRVSVVGEFNKWDGRLNQMNRVQDSGVFEIFMPSVKEGDKYLYEINMKNGISKSVLDPYATSIIYDKNRYVCQICADEDWQFDDKAFLAARAKDTTACKPVSIYEVDLSEVAARLSSSSKDKNKSVSYIEIAEDIATTAKKCGFTHVELKPIAEYDKEESKGYETIGYYAPTARYKDAKQFAQMINILHKENIKVILDWTLAHPSARWDALKYFDGTGCYEHDDPRMGIHPEWGTLLFNYGRGEVVSFLKSNACYWIEKYHIDGLRIDSLAPVLCLDYGRNDGQWVPNIYGGHENLDAVNFLKSLNDLIKKEFPGVITIAEDSSAWPRVTYPTSDDGLGFDYKWNIGWRDDYLRYSELDPIFRSGSHNDLTFSMIYCYSDRFILPLPIDAISDTELSLAYMLMHPGVKMVCGDIASKDDADKIVKFISDLNKFYKSEPALFELDNVEEGFEWINCLDSTRSILTFIRRGKTEENFVVAVANFAGIDQNINVGIPVPGKYTRIFNSDSSAYGGSSKQKDKSIYSIDGDVDSRPYYIPVEIPALSLSVFDFKNFDENDREYMIKLEQEAKDKALAAQAEAKKEETRAKAAQKKAETEQKKAEEAAIAAEKARQKAEEEYAKAQAELEKAREAMEKARLAAEKAELAAHRLEVTERSMKK